jgi:hypothetical protein
MVTELILLRTVHLAIYPVLVNNTAMFGVVAQIEGTGINVPQNTFPGSSISTSELQGNTFLEVKAAKRGTVPFDWQVRSKLDELGLTTKHVVTFAFENNPITDSGRPCMLQMND